MEAALVVLVLHAGDSVSTLTFRDALAIRPEKANTVTFCIDIHDMVALAMVHDVFVVGVEALNL